MDFYLPKSMENSLPLTRMKKIKKQLEKMVVKAAYNAAEKKC